MTVENTGFLLEGAYSLRPIDQVWLRKRAAELNPEEPDLQRALEEAVETLRDNLGHNLDEDAEMLLYSSDSNTDPYIVALPIKKRRNPGDQVRNVTPPVAKRPDLKESSIQLEFENILFESNEEFGLNDLEKNDMDEYVNNDVRQRWEGFKLYHEKLTIEATPHFKKEYHKSLGRYVVGKITRNGTSLFIKTPFRHQTKALAMEEACRLSGEHNEAFGIFRCLDIVSPEEK